MSKEKRKVKDYRVKYIGESWRSAYERGLEHQDDYRNLRVNSHMLKHAIEEHPEKKLEEMKFGMRVKMQFKSALERQVTEAVDIHQALRKGYKILNSKSEYTRCSVPRLKVENNKELLEKLIGEKESENRTKERIRNLKKRNKDPLLAICEEIEAKNCQKWKRRKLNEEVIRKQIEEKERIELEKMQRIERAQRKKEELLKRIK